MSWRAAILASTLALAACGGLERLPEVQGGSADADCRRWFAALDAAVDAAGVRDVEDERIAGYPFLRVNRLLAALAPRARASDDAFTVWLDGLRELDTTARRAEIANLGNIGTHSTLARLAACSAQLAESVRADPLARAQLLGRARVPDRYSDAARIAGLYLLTRGPFFAGVQAWQRKHEAAMRDAAVQPHPAHRLGPAGASVAVAREAPGRFARDALGLPILDAQATERLLAAHAPLFDIEAQGLFDAIGVPTWNAEGQVGVDTTRAIVYQRLTHTLVHDEALVQLVYTLWFPERPRVGAFDLLGGALDGVIVRLTLGPDGTPLLMDTVHACGCYHLFFPARGVTLRAGATVDEEWAFVPAGLPDLPLGSRLAVRIASATHDVIGISAADASTAVSSTYARRSESELRALPAAAGATRSLYGPDALVAGTERGERFLYWPMGVASAGAMRQWGHHATAFVGRRHFDDPYLIEQRFQIAAPSDAPRVDSDTLRGATPHR